MIPWAGWPYAAKAVIQFEFDTDHLNIWVTFAFPMDVDVTPSLDTWKVYVDDVEKAASSESWQDAWTLLLVVDNILSNPDRVLVEYEGPDVGLRVSWHKQWEPWGPILAQDIGS